MLSVGAHRVWNHRRRLFWAILIPAITIWGYLITGLMHKKSPEPTHFHMSWDQQMRIAQEKDLLHYKEMGVEIKDARPHDFVRGRNFEWFNQPDSIMRVGGEEENMGNSDDEVMFVDETLMKKMLFYPKRTNYTDHVLILTPIHNVGDMLDLYGELLKSLTYPHNLISVGLGEDSSTDNTLPSAKFLRRDLAKVFSRVEALHLNLPDKFHLAREEVHDFNFQFDRRKHLAEARNKLLNSTLMDEQWVLWIDSDVSYLPPDIIQQLMSADKDVVTPLCIMQERFIEIKRVYDKNTWRETPVSLEMQRKAPADKLFLEGYGPSYRTWLSNLRTEGRVVPIDGVGGCTLLIKAKCHRKGLIFPEFIYDHHIETEGLAKMAKHMGFGVYGMPFVEVIHR